MRTVTVHYARDALRQLQKLEKATAKRIVLKIAENAAQADPLSRAKALSGRLAGKYRYRIGDYRAVFMVDGKGCIAILTVIAVTHRKDAYR